MVGMSVFGQRLRELSYKLGHVGGADAIIDTML